MGQKKDHRHIGKELNIFDFESLIGSGMTIWLENGVLLKNTIINQVNKIQRKYGIKIVSTPELGKKELYKISGHLNHYQENMFPAITLDKEDEYILRPMTCPHHILLYKKTKWHEKQLPIAFGENAKLYRYEYSGGLFGLERTRCMELIDTHIFCSEEQITSILNKCWRIISEIKQMFEIEYSETIFSIRNEDDQKFYKDDVMWEKAETEIKRFLNANNINHSIGKGDAAFYGPKLDFQIETKLKKKITISTIQIDFLLPKKFKLEYFYENSGKIKTPIIIHLGIIGTLERFVSYLLEKDEGWLPFWLSPIQISIIPINIKKHLIYAKKLQKFYELFNIRTYVDEKNETVQKRIAKAIHKKSFGYIVVGDKEIEEIIRIDLNSLFKTSEENLKKEICKIKASKSDKQILQKDYENLIKWSEIKNE